MPVVRASNVASIGRVCGRAWSMSLVTFCLDLFFVLCHSGAAYVCIGMQNVSVDNDNSDCTIRAPKNMRIDSKICCCRAKLSSSTTFLPLAPILRLFGSIETRTAKTFMDTGFFCLFRSVSRPKIEWRKYPIAKWIRKKKRTQKKIGRFTSIDCWARAVRRATMSSTFIFHIRWVHLSFSLFNFPFPCGSVACARIFRASITVVSLYNW